MLQIKLVESVCGDLSDQERKVDMEYFMHINWKTMLEAPIVFFPIQNLQTNILLIFLFKAILSVFYV